MEAVKRVQEYLGKAPKWLIYALAAYGLLRTVKAALCPLAAVWRYKLRGLGSLLQRYGKDSYVLVTGASDGVGKALAYQFAALGFNLVLVARREALLEAIKADITGKFHVSVVSISFDLSQGASFPQLTAGILERISGLDVSILINNAGMAQDLIPFTQLTTSAIENLLHLNLVAPTLLTHLLMKQLAARQHRSAVVNVSSLLGQIPAYGASVYAGTKAYLRFLTYAVGEEAKDKVDFLTVNLGATTTAMTEYSKDFFAVMPEEVAYGIARDLGKYRETDATFRQHVSVSLMHLFPLSTGIAISSRILRRFAARNFP